MNLEIILENLQKAINPYGECSKLLPEQYKLFPEYIQKIFNYKLFGDDVLAVKGNTLSDDEDDHWQKPFRLVNRKEEIENFNSEFRVLFPNKFIKIGSIFNGDPFVILNTESKDMHIIYVSDIT